MKKPTPQREVSICNIRTGGGIIKATAVGGEEGVFAVRKVQTPDGRTLVELYKGDDGWWIRVATYGEDWIPAIIFALNRV